MMTAETDTRTAEALRAAADSDSGLIRTVAGFGATQMAAGHYIHYRTVSGLVKRGLLEYVGRDRAEITAAGRDALGRMEQA